MDSLEIERDSVLGMQIGYLEEIEKFYPFLSPNFYLFTYTEGIVGTLAGHYLES